MTPANFVHATPAFHAVNIANTFQAISAKTAPNVAMATLIGGATIFVAYVINDDVVREHALLLVEGAKTQQRSSRGLIYGLYRSIALFTQIIGYQFSRQSIKGTQTNCSPIGRVRTGLSGAE